VPGGETAAVLASGRGSNFEAILAAIRSGGLSARITHVVSDQPSAPVLDKAKAAGLTAVCVPVPAGEGSAAERRDRHEQALLEALGPEPPKWLVLAGYLRILGPRLLKAYRDAAGFQRIVNVHPSLLPAFPGLESYRRAWEHGCSVAGVTVHLVSADLDSGPICAQEAFSIHDCKDATEVEQRGLAVEHRLYPSTLQWLLNGPIKVLERPEGGRCVRPA
jgi:phosphoribosylglycinamide formyltransferase-1